MSNRSKGDAGEDYAAAILASNGYRILDRNYSTSFGEIDIVAMRGRCIHFVEVKAREGHECGFPAEAVGKRKQNKIRNVGLHYIRTRKLDRYDISFDVIEIETNMIENCF